MNYGTEFRIYNFKQTVVSLKGLAASLVLYVACYVHYVTHATKFN